LERAARNDLIANTNNDRSIDMAAQYPHPAFHFLVEAGFSRVGFARVLLPRLEREVIRYREGGSPEGTSLTMPGLLKMGDCVLERGVVPADNEFFQWLNTALVGMVERRDVVIKLLDAQHQPVMTWHLRNCFPSVLDWSVLDAQQSSVLIETLHLVAQSVQVETA
jgi:phage tail-like protein